MSDDWFRGTSDYGLIRVRQRLPVRAESLTQLGQGAMRAEATVIPAREGFLYYARLGTRSVTVAELDPAYTGIVLPLAWQGRFLINGRTVRDDRIYLPEDGSLFHVIGGRRESVGIALPRDEMVATVAALRGVERDDVRLSAGGHRIGKGDLAMARYHLKSKLNRYRSVTLSPGAEPNTVESPVPSVLESLLQLVIMGDEKARDKSAALGRYSEIVRKAEDRFASAGAEPVSLADLCAAANTSQGTLNHAFQTICGCSPIQYFKKRRLTDARLALLATRPARGRIKRVALDTGFTHFGRFSAEYRCLFGESPSVTLNQHPS